jgi:N-acetylmuramoyl-L-alanine amidase
MPSVLTEIGFMSNPSDLKHITSEKGQREIAGAIFRAVKQYVENVRRSLLIDSSTGATTPEYEEAPAPKPEAAKPTTKPAAKPTAKPAPAAKPIAKPAENPVSKSVVVEKRYAIQLLASAKSIPTTHPELKSYRGKAWVLEGSGSVRYKYCYGDYAEKSAAQKPLAEVRKEFPQAFIITYDKKR